MSYIEELAELSDTGHPFVAVTLVETTGSAPQDSGNKMLVTSEGIAHGTVGGGKVEFKAIERAQQMLELASDKRNLFVEWNLQNDVGMTCGGVVKLFFEVYNRDDWRIVVFGAGHVAQALVNCLATLDCHITCVDTREEWLAKMPTSDRLTTICCEDLQQQVTRLTDSDFIVCMTMGHATDLPVLAGIFRRQLKPAYLGVIGSQSKRKVLLRELAEKGIDSDAVGTLHCPIGLKLGSNQPAEIAISITAEMLQRRDALRSAPSPGE